LYNLHNNMSFLNRTKKLGAVSMIALSLVFSFPQKTHAQYVDIGTIIKEIGDTISYAFINTIINKVTASTVNWINSGFEGNPAYVTDPGQFFLDVGDKTASEVLSNTSLNQLCSPFKAQVRLALVKNYINQDQNGSCTLSKVKDNYEQFTQDFSKGGWEGWFEVTQNDNNNPYGAYLQTKSQLGKDIDNQVQKFNKQLEQGRGFLSKEACPKNKQLTLTEASQANYDYQTTLYKAGDCLDSRDVETVTPGSVIQGQLEKVLGSGAERLNAADEINEILGALLNQLIAKAMSGLKGLSESKPGEKSLTDQLRDEAPRPSPPQPPPYSSPTVTCEDTDNGMVCTAQSTQPAKVCLPTLDNEGNTTGEETCTTIDVTVDSDGGEKDKGPGTPDSEPSTLGAVCSAVATERAKYGTVPTKDDMAKILVDATSGFGSSGWGVLNKTSGNNCSSTYGPIACDIIFHGPSCILYDVFQGNAELTAQCNLADGNIPRSRWRGNGNPGTGSCTPFTPTGGGSAEPPAPTANPNPTPTAGSPVINSVSPMNVVRGQTTMTIMGTNLTTTVQFLGNSGITTFGSNDGVTTTGTQTKLLIPAVLPVGNYNVRVWKNSTTYSNDKGPIQVNNGTGTGGGGGLPTIIPTNIWSPTQTANGWYPYLSPDGKYVAYGNGETWVTNLQTQQNWNFTNPPDLPPTWMNNHACGTTGWIKSDTLSSSCFNNKTDTENIGFYRYETKIGEWLPRKTADDPRNVAGNIGKAKDGHWVALTGARIAKDNFVLSNSSGMGSPSISGNTLVTACNNNLSVCVWTGNTISKRYTAKPNVLDTDTYNGYIAYSAYDGSVRGITPTGGEVDLAVVKSLGLSESGVKILSVNGKIYVATFTWSSSANKGYILIRPWASKTYIAVETRGLLGSIVFANSNFIIATYGDRGQLEVLTVPSGLVDSAPGPIHF